MSHSSHQFILRQLLIELHEVNERIMAGDICSNKTALPRCHKLCGQYAKQYAKDGCADIRLEPYLAAGGWVGITYSYAPPGCEPVSGSSVPRRIQS
jgi:hypothetical protein